jgi:hypothetical protein
MVKSWSSPLAFKEKSMMPQRLASLTAKPGAAASTLF